MDGDYFKNKYKADSARLSDWDYSWAGYYFFTICTRDRENCFGEIRNGIMGLNDAGCAVWREWYRTQEIRKNVRLDEFIVMPNHVHGIIEIVCNNQNEIVETLRATSLQNTINDGMSRISPKSGSLSTIIRSFKSACTKEIHENCDIYFQWQPRYYDHIIRLDAESLEQIRCYIRHNPVNWINDEINQANYK